MTRRDARLVVARLVHESPGRRESPLTEIRKADPVARRRAVLLVAIAAVVGSLVLAAFEQYRDPLLAWLLSRSAGSHRLWVAFAVTLATLCAPLVILAVYLWALGVSVQRARQWPPPGYRVIRDTLVVDGPPADRRGRVLKALAVCLGVGSCVLLLAVWRLAAMLR